MNSIAKRDDNLANENSGQHIINHSTSYRVSSVAEIGSLLGRLSRQHTLLSITPVGSNTIFASMILEVNSDGHYLVLDELYPRNELKAALQNSKLAIETRCDGIELRFTVKVEAIAERDAIEYYKVSYPAFVYHHQRRSSFRVNVGLAESVALALSTGDDTLLHAELRDISLDGISARISTPSAQALAVGDEIPTCVMHTPEGKKILCSLEITRVNQAKPSQPLRIGARFIHIASSDRHELSRLIAKLDRENVKKLKRLPGRV